jgi:hypothetical protein
MSGEVLVSGASGPIGEALLPRLQERTYQTTLLVRRSATGAKQIPWNPTQPVNPDSVSGFDAVVHLAGEPIVGRWTTAKKAAIRDSRVLGTRHLSEALAQAPQPPRVLVSASAIGYYGDRGEELLREDSPPGQGFLAEVCQQWEAAIAPAAQAGIRVVHLRIGMVISPTGGALAAMLTPFRLGLGGRIGSGRQWWSWIDVRDVVGAILHAIETESLRGPVNAVSPNPVTNSEFTRELAEALSRPAIFPLPAFAARLALGQMTDELLLASERIEPARLLASGFQFRYGELPASLRANLGK